MEYGEQVATDPPWWKPHPLTYLMWILAAWCVGSGWIALRSHVTSSDAAGNGMATAMTHGFAGIGLKATVVLAGLYLLIGWKPVRYLCIASLLLVGVMLLILVR